MIFGLEEKLAATCYDKNDTLIKIIRVRNKQIIRNAR